MLSVAARFVTDSSACIMSTGGLNTDSILQSKAKLKATVARTGSDVTPDLTHNIIRLMSRLKAELTGTRKRLMTKVRKEVNDKSA